MFDGLMTNPVKSSLDIMRDSSSGGLMKIAGFRNGAHIARMAVLSGLRAN
jgi:hypothetical protein